MTVVNKPYQIIDIECIKENPIDPGLSVYRIKAVLGSWIEKSYHGRQIILKKGLERFMGYLEKEYGKSAECFIATVPATGKTLEYNNYHIGGEINIAYFPYNVKIKAEVVKDDK